jgi:tungstate transport system substrate-binding protein
VWKLFARATVVALFLCPLVAAYGDPPAQSIVLASTTSVENSGLLAAILPNFTKATGISVRVLALGTGQALDTARRGDADLVLVHDPEAEQKFIDDGNGINRRQIAWNDFIFVGPEADPAHIIGTHDAVAALEAIAPAKAAFVSRGDRSGTNALELRLWKAAEIDPKSGAGSWYRDIGSGMGAALNAAAAMPAYTLSDRGTWLSFKNKQTLVVAVEGDPHLINRYDVIELSPAKHADAKLAAAHKFADWLVSTDGQMAIGAYLVGDQQLFNPSARESGDLRRPKSTSCVLAPRKFSCPGREPRSGKLGRGRCLDLISWGEPEGYSRLMGRDEVGTLRVLTAYRAIIGDRARPATAFAARPRAAPIGGSRRRVIASSRILPAPWMPCSVLLRCRTP